MVGALLAQTLRISVPYAFASLGGTFSERGGTVNIALEGILLNSAFATAVGTLFLHSPWLGVLAGMTAGILTSLLHAVACVVFRADQIVSGVAINLLSAGLTKFLLKVIFDSTSNSPRFEGLPEWSLPWLADVPPLRTLLGTPLILLAAVCVVVGSRVLFRTPFGLRLRACGEHPEAADSMGVNVAGTRIAGVLISGALGGLGGAWLALDQHSFTDGMSGGRGYIALAAMIVGKWNPLGGAGACLLFGLAETMQLRLQGGSIPTQFIQMIPYVLTIVVLAGFIGRALPPRAVGVPYRKEQ
ncbi:MAG: ABC transporter permease [Candidatus Eisenbacteria bacterium]|nr:ABC transporter permease [Candidatus Eisenbacteria bacterium]